MTEVVTPKLKLTIKDSVESATLTIQKSDPMLTDLDKAVSDRLDKYKFHADALVLAASIRGREAASQVESTLSANGWVQAGSSALSNSLMAIGGAAVKAGAPAQITSVVAGILLQMAAELENPTESFGDLILDKEATDLIGVASKKQGLQTAYSALKNSVSTASASERHAALESFYNYIVSETPEADLGFTEGASGEQVRDEALAKLPSADRIAESLVYQVIQLNGLKLEYEGDGNWDVIGAGDIPFTVDFEDLADWLKTKGITHPTTGIVDLQKLIDALNSPPTTSA